MSKPTVLSLFSGIGGFDLGLERAGFQVMGQVEIDPFCNQVLAAHWPEVRRYGDVRRVGGCGDAAVQLREDDGQRAVSSLQSVDLICGGFPCQDLSVAGKRAGLAGERSGLWFEFYRILSELRPAACLIENVPGLLSSNNGRDFGVILNGLEQLWPGRWGWAVLDSQHFGVPQRRRRLYVIAGPRRERIAQILSLCEGGDWHPQKGRETGEGVAYALNAGVRGTGDGHGNAWNSNYVANPIGSKDASGYRLDLDNETYVPDLAPALASRDSKGQREDIAEPAFIAHALRAKDGTHVPADVNDANLIIAHSLTSEGFDAGEDGTGRGTPLVVPTMSAGSGDAHYGFRDEHGVVTVRTAQTSSNGWGINEDGTAYTLDGAEGQAVSHGAAVRRLTPVECERLQGFPDNWTRLDEKTPDGPRYRALGNAVTVPVIEYIGLRLREVL